VTGSLAGSISCAGDDTRGVCMNGLRSTTAMAIAMVAAIGALAAQGTKSGRPEDHLPSNITQLSAFGERASWSPDGRHIAFMSKSFGDAFVVDVTTKMIRLLTHYQHAGYLRVQYLPNGDFLLIGARTFTDIRTTRSRDQEMWVLKADGRSQPVPLDHKISEGVAISRKNAKIAWSTTHGQYPDVLAEGTSVIYTADIVEEGGRPRLVNKKEVIRASGPECTLEAQDFRSNDTELIYTCYRSPFADVLGVDLNSGKVTTYRKVAGEYNEVEGIFPDGTHALVESSREQTEHNSSHVDIWKLRLEPESTDYVRMTRWTDYPGYKASNPVVSPDGRTIAFQSARSSDPAGVGYGTLLLKVR
jgi:dipeptidyl aminopeptidase/acylaminoacyl peptidase